MPQIQFHDVTLSHGHPPLLDKASFSVNKRDRIAIIGRNGAGKSTLLKLIEGSILPDGGNIERERQLRITSMAQHVPENLLGTIFDYVSKAHHSEHEWESYQVDSILAQLKLTPDLLLQHASGGQVRRTLLAAALVNEPDVLLLDEPTNHLDLESIVWLEEFLLNYKKTIMFITHDRAFMQKLSTRIIEIDIGKLTSWQGDYEGFLKNKTTELAAEAHAQKVFDKKLSQEEAWIRKGVKARRARNEGRVHELEKMRAQYAERRKRQGDVSITQGKVDYAGKVVFKLGKLTIDHEGKTLVKDFSTSILRGDKVAIIGSNGCGKSSLIKVMLGEDKPRKGYVKQGTNVQVVYFDQHRGQLDLEATAVDNVGDGADEIMIGNKSKHVLSYLQDFLFTPEKARSLVRTFSGGERNRLLLAKILAKPSNVLILDEPTNDLDMEALDILDEFLVNYSGTLVLVSHDRALLNNVATQTIVFEGDGILREYVGGYDDWLRQRSSQPNNSKIKKQKNAVKEKKTLSMTYEERKELSKLPKMIEKLEQKIKQCHEVMAASDFYQQGAVKIEEQTDELKQFEIRLEEMYERWALLEARQ